MVQQFAADQPNSDANSDARAIANLSETIIRYQRDLSDLEAEKLAIKQRLKSLMLIWLESIGIKRDNLKDLKQINAVDMRLLSSDDLKRKLNHCVKTQKSVQALINDLRTKIHRINEAAKARVVAESLAQQNRVKEAYVEQYKNKPAAFFAAVAADEKNNITTDERALYKIADQIIATCDLFDATIDPHHLWSTWKLMDRVRSAEQRQNPQLHTYTDGAAKLLQVLCNIDNRFGNITGIELLFNAKNYEKVNSYLRRIFLEDIIMDPEQHQQMLAHLKQDVIAVVDQKRAIKKLPKQ